MSLVATRRFGLALAFAAPLIAAMTVAPLASAAPGPYYKTVGDTGVQCSVPGPSPVNIYKSSYYLTGTQMISQTGPRFEVRRSVNGDAAGTYQVWFRAYTFSKADKYWVCNRLHTTKTGYYYTYAEIHYLSSRVTKCLTQYGLHVGGLPSTASYSWTGSTFSGHVRSNPC